MAKKVCQYCRGTMRVSEQSYAENPFCRNCFIERLALAAKERPDLVWVQNGKYMIPVERSAADLTKLEAFPKVASVPTAKKTKTKKTIVEQRMEKAFGAVVLAADETKTLCVTPPRGPLFEPKRFRITCLDLSDPSHPLDVKVGAVTVGGAPQLAINTLAPKAGSNQVLSVHDLDGSNVQWLVFSTAGLARELQIAIYNPHRLNVAAFACVDGFPWESMDDSDRIERQALVPSPACDPYETQLGSGVMLDPLEQRAILIIPTVNPYFEPKRIRFNGHRTDTGASVPFSVINAYVGSKLLYDGLDESMFTQEFVSVSDAQELLVRIKAMLESGKAKPTLRGLLTEHMVDEGGWGDVSWWPCISTLGLGHNGGIIVRNPWPFRIRASVCLSGISGCTL